MDTICHVFRDAFDSEGETIAGLASDMMKDESDQPSFALIAEGNGETAGCVIFSPARISGSEILSASILAPLAVVKRFQRMGIGRKLIEAGLSHLREQGTDLVSVLGDPAYDVRYGFSARHHVQPSYELPYPEAWMIRELSPGSIGSAKGRFECSRALMAPEHW